MAKKFSARLPSEGK